MKFPSPVKTEDNPEGRISHILIRFPMINNIRKGIEEQLYMIFATSKESKPKE